MATLEKRLEDPAYNRWVKAGICLGFVKTGLEVFADQRSQVFHQGVLGQLRNSGNPSCNGICGQATVWRGKISCCNNCQGFVDEIDRQNMKSFRFQQGNWGNSDVQLWPKDPWEMAKIFMNPGQKSSQRSPADTDLSGILNFIDHCALARRDITNTYNISKVRDSRNKVMHSSTMALSQQELDDYIDAMIALLEDSGPLGTMNSAQNAVKEIHETKEVDFCITKECEFKVLTEKTEVLQLKLELVHKEVKKLRNESANIGAEAKQNTVSLKELESDTDRNMSSFKERLHTMEMIDDELRSNIEIMKKTLNKDIDLRETFGNRMEKLDISLEGVESVLEVLTKGISEIHQKLETLVDESAMQKLQGNTLISRQDTLEQRENFLEEQLQKLQMASCSLDSKGAADLKEDYKDLQRCLVEEYRRVGFDISLSPIYEDVYDDTLKVNLDEVYTELKIVKPQKKEELPLCSYKEIFHTDGSRNRTIIVKGEAGVGKSTWCMQLVQAWTKVHEPTYVHSAKIHSTPASTIDNVIDLEEAMSAFDFMFFVQLRYVEGKRSIKDIIFSSSLERLSNFQATVRHIIDRYSEKVLIILDGIDEYALNLGYEGLNLCTVISTTRPWKYDIICSRNTKVDIVLKIAGLDANGVVELAEKFFKVLNYQTSTSAVDKSNENAIKAKVDNFMETVRSTGMSDSVKTPLILLIMLETYMEKGYLSSSRTCNLFCLVETLIIRGEQKLSENEMTKLETLKECWSGREKSSNVPDRNETLSEYSCLLQKLSNLAYEGINRTEKEYTLVFSEKELNHYFSQDELQICLRYGLLSKSKQFTSFLTRMKVSISFYHKLFQEFFAAMCIVNFSECFAKFKSSINSIHDVIETENVIYFIHGTNSHLGSHLTRHVVDICNRDPLILEQRNDINSSVVFPMELHHMSSILLQCQEEVCLSDQPCEPVYASDISIFSNTSRDATDCALKLMSHSKHCLKSLFVQCIQFPLAKCHELLELINESIVLETLVLVMPSFITEANSKDMLQLATLKLDFSRHCAFKNCYLVGRGQSTSSGLLPLVRNFGYTVSLVRLRLRNIGSECCNTLSNIIVDLKNLEFLFMDHMVFTEGDLLLQNSKLRTLHMRYVTLKNSSVVLSNVFDLYDVSIKFTEMQRAGWENLLDELKYQPKLENLVIQNVNCVDGKLDLENSTLLEYLKLYDFAVSDMRISTCKQLKVLDIRKIYLPSSPGYPESTTSGAELTYWQAVLNGGERICIPYSLSQERSKMLDLETCNEEDEKGRECDLASLQESSFSYSAWGRILGAVPADSLKHLMLYNLHIGNASISLENCQHLETISLYQLTMSEESYRRLVSSIAGFTSLPELDIKELNVSGVLRGITVEDIKTIGVERTEESSR